MKFVYLSRSTIGHINNDPEAYMYENFGILQLKKNVLKNILKDEKQIASLNDLSENLILIRAIDRGPGWFIVDNYYAFKS